MSERTVHYREAGVSLLWLLPAPIAAIGMIISEVAVGNAGKWWIWALLGLLGELLAWIQVMAGRTHIGVELTDDELRCGSETLALADIAEILPGSTPDHGTSGLSVDAPPWRTARAMGRLGTVPRRRYGVGLRTTDRAKLQAWAKNDYALRAHLVPLLAARSAPAEAPPAET
jgi:hypothetical protein